MPYWHHYSCGSSTRTNDLKVMSLASYQLLHPAILRLALNALSLEFECKDSNFFHSFQIFLPIFSFYVIFGHQNGPFDKLAADKPWNFSTGCTAAHGAGTLIAPLSLSPSAARSVAPRPTCPRSRWCGQRHHAGTSPKQRHLFANSPGAGGPRRRCPSAYRQKKQLSEINPIAVCLLRFVAPTGIEPVFHA